MTAVALALGAVVGLVLGLVGGGGSMLAVPLLGLLGLDPAGAKAGALLIVAAAALASLGPHLRAGAVDGRAALLTGGAGAPASLVTALLARRLPGPAQSALFALVALAAGALLVRGARRGDPAPSSGRARVGPVLLAGVGAGALTGLVGVGGGFAVVPALTLVAGLSPRRAVATSLVVVAVNALAGLGAVASQVDLLDRRLVLFALGAAAAGVGGASLAGRVPQARLRQLLGGLLLVVGLAMLALAGLELRA